MAAFTTTAREGIMPAMLTLLSVMDLRVEVDDPELGWCEAVRGLDFDIERGESLGLVGESGCGKSLTVLALLGLLPAPTVRLAGGEMLFDGEPVQLREESSFRPLRGRRIGYVPQDAMTSLNPVFAVGEQLAETLRAHHGTGRREARKEAVELMRQVGIPSPGQRYGAYPHELSGGQRQRILIAISLAGDPELLALDEPTTALDVTVQAQILRLLATLRRDRALGQIFVTHDLGLVSETCDRVLILYAGRCVETGDARSVLREPAHPYTRALLDSVPGVGRTRSTNRGSRLMAIKGTVPGVGRWPDGCAFRDRCPRTIPACTHEEPELRALGDRFVACHAPGARADG